MKGYLTYLILWILGKNSMNGAEIGRELEKRRGTIPSPGTIYPALKDLKNKGLIDVDDGKNYSLTSEGKKELELACKYFFNIFYDIEEMLKYCKQS
ncbi:MAG: PadR family transcriptional regulator [Methanobacterium sp.]